MLNYQNLSFLFLSLVQKQFCRGKKYSLEKYEIHLNGLNYAIVSAQ